MALEMSKTRIINPSADAMDIIIQREQITATGAYETVNPTPLSMDDPSSHVLGYRSYWLSMSVVFNLKDILGWIIFVFGGNEEH